MSKPWPQCPLGELVSLERKSLTPEDITAGTIFVGLEHIDGDGNFNDMCAVAPGDIGSAKFQFSSAHVLYGRLRPYLRKVARPYFSGVCSTDILPLLPGARVDKSYLFHFLRYPPTVDLAVVRCTGANLPRLSSKALLNLDVPLPPIEEQRRIAAILDKADAIRRKRREAIALTEELLRSTFLEMFGDPTINPKKWPRRALGSMIALVESGWSAPGEDRPRRQDEWGVLKVSAVSSGIFRPDEHKAVAKIESGKPIIVPRRGDLLFSRANTRELVAAACLVESDESHQVFLPDKLWRIVPGDQACSEFICVLLQHKAVQASIAKVATGTSGSMLNVSQEKVRSVVVPVPDHATQLKFSDLYWKIAAQRARLYDARREADALFESLTHQAFTGQL